MAHGHEHHDGNGHSHTHVDFAEMLPMLEQEAELYSPLYTQAASWLREMRPDPELVVDAGSGPGVISCLLADTFPGARVIAVDGAEPLLERARERAAERGVADRFGTLRAELGDGLGDLEYPADLLWASRSLHHVGDQRGALAGFADRLAPGGTLALLEGGLAPRYLPRDFGIGRPGLHARIDAVEQEWFARMRAELPGAVVEDVEDWPALLTAVGLRHTATRTFLLDLPAPVSDEARAFVATALGHRRDGLGEHLDADDRATLDRLLDPEDKASVYHRPDVFVLTALTVYVGVKP
ncbi:MULTISPECIES: class I SAM-dependent methyltransferase [Streptomyces]|uniref:class I SAM-dependent methyltransferase n=1 Tax=Streptomyces TaxID=1883 RepID=UPI002010056D|nr:class I SAM-dependent methyltransferase [Streptomyces sp. LRE541]UPZ28033.1 class I SAM-dependent methyltransferase [Streptomyces sp. LRE541]